MPQLYKAIYPLVALELFNKLKLKGEFSLLGSLIRGASLEKLLTRKIFVKLHLFEMLVAVLVFFYSSNIWKSVIYDQALVMVYQNRSQISGLRGLVFQMTLTLTSLDWYYPTAHYTHKPI